jgi:V/A-type H+-transporting ATPase subunit I
MFLSARMKKIEILTLVADEPQVTEAVGEMGVLHLTRAPAESGAAPVDEDEARDAEGHLGELERRAEELCSVLGIDVESAPEEVPHTDTARLEGELNRISDAVREITEERNRLTGARQRIEKLLRDTAMLRDIEAPVEQLEEMSFLHFAIGGLREGAAAEVEEEMGDRAVVLPYQSPYGEDRVVAISSKKGRWALETALEKHGFRSQPLPEGETGVPATIARLAEERMADLLERTKANNAAVRAAAEEYGDRLRAVACRLRTERRIAEARANFAHTWATMLITGWVPEERVNALCETVLELTDGRAVIEVRDPGAEDGEPPTMMDNPSLFRPFEMFVAGYSTPRYNEIDPTPFMTVLFLVMFGMMFGDVGHSGLLMLAGGLMWWRGRERVRDFGVVLTFCGLSGMIFGFVYGSVFGIEEFGGQRFGLVSPMKNARALLAITVLFGAGVITLGLALNIINHLRRGEASQMWFDKFGVAGAVFYVGSVTLAVRAAVGGRIGWLPIVLLVVAPLVLLFAHRPLVALLRRKKPAPGDENVFLLLIESAIEAFEAVLLYMANTLSFARIAAFALAHAGLSFAIFRIMDVVQSLPGGPLWAAFVFLAGTLVILLLEGLIVGIQSMRLQYYEFFNKFFQGEGRAYRPFTLHAREPRTP